MSRDPLEIARALGAVLVNHTIYEVDDPVLLRAADAALSVLDSPECGLLPQWTDGIYDPVCRLPAGHDGPHVAESPDAKDREVDPLSLMICPSCDRPCDDHDDECPALAGSP